MKSNELEEKTEEFWKKVRNHQIDHAIVFMIISELRQCDPLTESNSMKMGRLSKMKALVELIDLEEIYKKTERIVDSDDDLLNAMQE